MKTLNSKDKNNIVTQLDKQFGVNKVNGLFLRFGREKIRLYSGNMSKDELIELDKNIRVENIGMYFAKIQNDGIRLSLDGVNLIKNNISKNILEFNDKQAEEWMKGNDIYINMDKSFKILVNKGDFLGCSKSTGEKITNSVPKERRVKN